MAYSKYTAAYTVIVQKLHHNYTAAYKTKQLVAYNSQVLKLYSIFFNSYTVIQQLYRNREAYTVVIDSIQYCNEWNKPWAKSTSRP